MTRLSIDRKHMSQPSGGWGLPMENGPILSDPKLDGLISKIKAYRESNGLPVGDPEGDIARHYAPKFPWLILSGDDSGLEENAAETWIHWLWRSYPLQATETRVRESRFEQCFKCKYFEPLVTEDLTDECSRRLLCLNPHKSRSEHGWCSLRGWVCSVAVQIQDPWKFAEWGKKQPECWLDAPTEPVIKTP